MAAWRQWLVHPHLAIRGSVLYLHAVLLPHCLALLKLLVQVSHLVNFLFASLSEPHYPKIQDSLLTASKSWSGVHGGGEGKGGCVTRDNSEKNINPIWAPDLQTLLIYSFLPPHKLVEPQTPVAMTIGPILGLRVCAHYLPIVQSTPTLTHILFFLLTTVTSLLAFYPSCPMSTSWVTVWPQSPSPQNPAPCPVHQSLCNSNTIYSLSILFTNLQSQKNSGTEAKDTLCMASSWKLLSLQFWTKHHHIQK